jgi:hypothetical protein
MFLRGKLISKITSSQIKAIANKPYEEITESMAVSFSMKNREIHSTSKVEDIFSP